MFESLEPREVAPYFTNSWNQKGKQSSAAQPVVLLLHNRLCCCRDLLSPLLLCIWFPKLGASPWHCLDSYPSNFHEPNRCYSTGSFVNIKFWYYWSLVQLSENWSLIVFSIYSLVLEIAVIKGDEVINDDEEFLFVIFWRFLGYLCEYSNSLNLLYIYCYILIMYWMPSEYSNSLNLIYICIFL